MRSLNVFGVLLMVILSALTISARPQQVPLLKPQVVDGFIPIVGDKPRPESRKIVFPGESSSATQQAFEKVNGEKFTPSEPLSRFYVKPEFDFNGFPLLLIDVSNTLFREEWDRHLATGLKSEKIAKGGIREDLQDQNLKSFGNDISGDLSLPSQNSNPDKVRFPNLDEEKQRLNSEKEV